MKILRYIILFFFLLSSSVWATTYNWYFSDDAAGNAAGNDSTGDGSIGSPWKTLHKVQEQMLTLGSSDIANIYFDRADTWDASTANWNSSAGLISDYTSNLEDKVLCITNGTVHIDAYGTGAKPIFDGGITSFVADPLTANRGKEILLEIRRNDSSVKNIEIKNHQHGAIRLYGDISGTTIEDCKISNVGWAAFEVWTGANRSYYNNTVENVEAYDIIQLKRYGHVTGWPPAISFSAGGASPPGLYYGNAIRHCKVDRSYGEGIVMSMGYGPVGNEVSYLEYNLIANTWHPALILNNDAGAGVGYARYNEIITTADGSDYSSVSSYGIWVYHEYIDGADLETYGDYEIYGNIIIAQSYGIYLALEGVWYRDTLGSLKIYNNTIIDSLTANWYVNTGSSTADYGNCQIYNNASMFFDNSGKSHIIEGPNSDYVTNNITISDNFYWDELAQSYGSVDGDWDTNYKTGDPLLPGEAVPINWDGIATVATLDFDTHLLPPDNSALVDNGADISGWASDLTFLTIGTDFNDLTGTETFTTAEQDVDASWDLGAIISTTADVTAPTTVSSGPSGSIPFTTTTEIYHNIDENGTCKWDADDVTYDNMADGTFDGAGTLEHTDTVSVSEGANTFYTRCIDTATNEQAANTTISFTVQDEASPSDPSPTAFGVGISGNFSTQ